MFNSGINFKNENMQALLEFGICCFFELKLLQKELAKLRKIEENLLKSILICGKGNILNRDKRIKDFIFKYRELDHKLFNIVERSNRGLNFLNLNFPWMFTEEDECFLNKKIKIYQQEKWPDFFYEDLTNMIEIISKFYISSEPAAQSIVLDSLTTRDFLKHWLKSEN